jgi:farnesyl-diphosphate farnesyltransferase
LLSPETHGRFAPFYGEYLALAHAQLAAGWAYTLSLPRRCVRLRLACAWPILIGLRTLDMLKKTNVLDPDQRIKVSRAEVRQILARSLIWYAWPPAWRRLFPANGLNLKNGDEPRSMARPGEGPAKHREKDRAK